jgi:phosphatidylglycerol:prolipoprotein diacylglycerol transferase
MIGLAVGRIGDVINGEHHGTPTTLPWGVDYVNVNTLGEPGKVVHPEVAYEMVLCLGVLALILPFHRRLRRRLRRRLPDGVLGLTYLAVYALGRFFLSYFRADLQIVFGLRQAQIASALMVLFAIAAIPILLRRARAGAAPAPETVDRGESTRAPLDASSEPSESRRSTTAAKPANSHAAGGNRPSS